MGSKPDTKFVAKGQFVGGQVQIHRGDSFSSGRLESAFLPGRFEIVPGLADNVRVYIICYKLTICSRQAQAPGQNPRETGLIRSVLVKLEERIAAKKTKMAIRRELIKRAKIRARFKLDIGWGSRNDGA